jgi:hypothetical protein
MSIKNAEFDAFRESVEKFANKCKRKSTTEKLKNLQTNVCTKVQP